jgi:DNA-binding transcriptional MerR regulator
MVKPTKMYYSITEVAEITGLKPHILRYWETEFPVLHPKKNRAGNRAYRTKDIDIVKTIRRLLYDEGYTIEGAKRQIKITKAQGIHPDEETLEQIAEQAEKKTAQAKVPQQTMLDLEPMKTLKAREIPPHVRKALTEIRSALKEILVMLDPPKKSRTVKGLR